jgi:hypothetical protein
MAHGGRRMAPAASSPPFAALLLLCCVGSPRGCDCGSLSGPGHSSIGFKSNVGPIVDYY